MYDPQERAERESEFFAKYDHIAELRAEHHDPVYAAEMREQFDSNNPEHMKQWREDQARRQAELNALPTAPEDMIFDSNG